MKEVPFETTVDTTKFTFMIDTTDIIRNDDVESGQKTTGKHKSLIKLDALISRAEVSKN
jgi:hypothetical protein